MPAYQYIRDIYLGWGESRLKGFSTFYEYIYEQFLEDSESELYGGMSLADSYIEPTLKVIKNKLISLSSVRSYLEEWLEWEDPITIICGEPGQGKTSLCHKAMCDFYKDGWLAGKVSNVFCFSLNPANTNVLSNNAFYFYGLLSWGNDRKNHIISEEDCRNALIFLDGFDELIEWYPKFNLRDFIRKYIIPFCKNTDSHIVITSRTMAVDPNIPDYTFRNGIKVAVNKLQLINKEAQLSWIKRYMQRVQESSLEDFEDIENYYRDYRQLLYEQDEDDDSINNILGIPIIFRMIVTAHYHPTKGQSITEIFNELFEITWDRHNRQDDKDPMIVKSKLAMHALKIFIDDNDTAETDTLSSSSWLFSFYTTHEGKKRVGFLHRSFYQYFLAYEILSWYQRYKCYHETNELRDRLAYLARKKLDKTTLAYIKELYMQVEDKEALGESFEKAYFILKATDGILLLPEDKNDAKQIQTVCSLERALNVFWNSISIGSICGNPLLIGKINTMCLRTYDLSDCYLLNAQLEGADLYRSIFVGTAFKNATLRRADISAANLSRADLSSAILSGANLSSTNFSGADLSGAKLDSANLSNANFSDANLSGANLSGANLSGVNFNGANLSNANFSGAYLNGAKLGSANLSNANLSNVSLSGAKLDGTNLCDANLNDANLSGAEMNGANLSGANFSGANFQKTRINHVKLKGAELRKIAFTEADISNVVFVQADLSEADFRDASLRKVDFRLANLNEANLSGGAFISSYLSKADFKRANLVRTLFIDTNISRVEFCGADLSGAVFSGSSLIETKLIGANLSRAYFREVNLSGSNFREANLRNADFGNTYFVGVDLFGANIRETDFNDTKFNQVNIDIQNSELLQRQGYDTSAMNIVGHSPVET